MKKHISAGLAALMAASTLSAFSASAESYGDKTNIMVLGDSIAAGAGLEEYECNYGQLIADYLGGTVENYAAPDSSSADVLAKIKAFDSTQKAQLADSDVVIISTGANDMIYYTATSFILFAASNNLLAEGKMPDDLPEEINFDTLSEFVDIEAVKAYCGNLSNALLLSDKIDSIYKNLTYTDEQKNGSAYVQVIAKEIIPNIEAMVKEIRAVNPDAEIVVQNVYNPLQFSAEYEKHLKDSYSASYFSGYIQFKTLFDNVTKKFSEQLKGVEGIKVADVLADFTSVDKNQQKYGHYFTNIQGGRKNFDVFPTQAGHAAMAVSVLNALGESSDDGGQLAMIFKNLPNVESYPEYALEQYKKVAGSYVLGDINNDNLINSSDASVVLEQYALLSTGKNPSVPDELYNAGDVNSDGFVNSSDASLILAYYAYASTGNRASLKNYLANN